MSNNFGCRYGQILVLIKKKKKKKKKKTLLIIKCFFFESKNEFQYEKYFQEQINQQAVSNKVDCY